MADGFVKLWRGLLKKAIWTESSPGRRIILITLLLMVSHEKNQRLWRGRKHMVQPGQIITSVDEIIDTAGKGITRQMVRSALAKFSSPTYDFLTIEATKRGTLITITNWPTYQTPGDDSNQRATNRNPPNNQASNHDSGDASNGKVEGFPPQPTGNNQVINQAKSKKQPLSRSKSKSVVVGKEVEVGTEVREEVRVEDEDKTVDFFSELNLIYVTNPKGRTNWKLTRENVLKLLVKGTSPEDLLTAAKHYCQSEGPRHSMGAQRFFNTQENWRAWVDPGSQLHDDKNSGRGVPSGVTDEYLEEMARRSAGNYDDE